MSKFKTLLENILLEYDRDDPSDNPWLAAKLYKQSQYEKNKLYSKPINPISKQELVYIKAIFISQQSYKSSIFYISNSNKPYVKDKNLATKYSVKEAENFINNHPKQIVKDKNNNSFERHFEIEKC